ncbi:MAG: signal peptidase II [Gemmatimonadaceae bacterium]
MTDSDATAAPEGWRGPLFGVVALTVVLLDVTTKILAERHLPLHEPQQVIGQLFQLTLAYNYGAAFGMHLGSASRWVFGLAALVGLVVIGRLALQTPPTDRPRLLALALIFGGAAGNLIDRIRSPQGVVDFIDVGIGAQHRFWTFNIADSAVTVGAILLLLVLWLDERVARSAPVP